MRSTIVLHLDSNTENPVSSIVSLLENTVKPNIFCIITNDQITNKTNEIMKSFLKSCCDNGDYKEEVSKDYTIYTKIKDNFKIVYIVLKNYTNSEISKFAFEYLQNETDVYITANSNNLYQDRFIEKHINKHDSPFVGAVYSDYIRNGKYVYLSSIHPLIGHQIEIGDVSFNNGITKDLKMGNVAEIINIAYSRSLVRHIPEAIFLT
jgi:hypothetical protein